MNLFCQNCGHEITPQYRFCPACGGRHLRPTPLSNPVQQATRVAVPVPGAGVTGLTGRANFYAGFWLRAGAFVVDLLLLFTLLFFTRMAINFASPYLEFDKAEGLFDLIALFIFWMYYSIQESSVYRATAGKRALRLQVADEKGCRLGFSRASVRFFAKIPSGLLLGGGFLMVAFTEHKQGLHDKLASTVVTKGHGHPFTHP